MVTHYQPRPRGGASTTTGRPTIVQHPARTGAYADANGNYTATSTIPTIYDTAYTDDRGQFCPFRWATSVHDETGEPFEEAEPFVGDTDAQHQTVSGFYSFNNRALLPYHQEAPQYYYGLPQPNVSMGDGEAQNQDAVTTGHDPGSSSENDVAITGMAESGAITEGKSLPLICEINNCGKVFCDKLSLEEHRIFHDANSKLRFCKVSGCNKHFDHPKDVRRHLKSHSHHKTPCPVCNKRLQDRDDNMRRHLSVHKLGEDELLEKLKLYKDALAASNYADSYHPFDAASG